MQKAEYVFDVNPMDTERLCPQVSQALEKRTELVSRERFPGLWKVTDYFRGKRTASEAEKKKHRIFMRICGIVNLILGIILLVPGLMAPREAPVLVVAGILAVAAGIAGLRQAAKKKKKNRFLRPAERLLRGKGTLEKGGAQVSFFESGFEARASDSDSDAVPYPECECLIEAEDIFLLVFSQRAMLLQKQDISRGEIEGFREFICGKIKFAAV